MTSEIANTEDVIDSRDIIERIEELTAKRDAITEAQKELGNMRNASAEEIEEAQEELDAAEEDFDDDERAELAALLSLQEEAEGYADDWRHGAALIRESYFVEYCQELVDDIGDLPNLPGYIVIDWEATAANIRHDYTAVDFDGITYLIR